MLIVVALGVKVGVIFKSTNVLLYTLQALGNWLKQHKGGFIQNATAVCGVGLSKTN